MFSRKSNGISLYPSGTNPSAKSIKDTQNKFESLQAQYALTKSLHSTQNTEQPSGDQNPDGNSGGKFAGSSNAMSAISKGLGSIGNVTTAMNSTGNAQALSIRNGITDAAINSGNPYAMAIGAALKVVDAVGDVAGTNLDNLDKSDAKRAGIDSASRFINNAVQALPGIGTILGAFGSITRSATDLDEFGRDVLGSYSGSEEDIKTARRLANKNLLGKASKQADSYIYDTNQKASIMNQLGYTNSLVKNSDYSRDIAQQNLARYAGTNYNLNAVGRNGMKILSRKELQQILATQKLQKGGVIGTDTNILPEGSLHARLNHLDETNPDIEATRKGIPVLDANGDQVAEIERNELVFRLELTKKIEELMKDGSEEAMIKAGKILVDEIIDNTQDNTGQITEEVKNGI